MPGYRADVLEDTDRDLESWRGIDVSTGAEVVLRRSRGHAGHVEVAEWRSSAIQGIDHPGLAAPRQLFCHGDDLVVVYDAPGLRAEPRLDSRVSSTDVAALLCAVAGQLHALHAAGMTHGSIGATTVRRGHDGAVLIGAAEAGLRDGSRDDRALDDVRSLAGLGMDLLGSAGDRRTDDAASELTAILEAAAAAEPDGDDPCDPEPSADLVRHCKPLACDEATATIRASAGSDRPDRTEYVARHRRTPARRRWSRVRRNRPVGTRPGPTADRTASRPARTSMRRYRRVGPARVGVVSGPATGIAIVAVLVAIAAWLGTVWGGGAPQRGPVPTAAAHQPVQPKDTAALDATGGPDGFDANSASPAQWADYLNALYVERASAIDSRTAESLDRVYTPSSPQRAADLSLIAMLVNSGARIDGFAPELVAVNDISRVGPTAVLSVADRIPPYALVEATGIATSHAGRDEQAVTLTLELVAGRWLIDTAIRAA
ncbi:hypothetical protein CLV47_11061 [Antricoccus suffuscus]|uniref:Protein kinase domain-containing protein n=1 Tax=Antricoccus suffuscus TaxID=1629062 RepID=A0A2T0ZYG5_9ACTN|nr:hypothetical protein CLV47_11061 [Antricoccus suffuscus]